MGGRTMQGRRWSEGLHQAIEAKEGMTVQQESLTLASITYQNLFRSFSKLAGMTGTAATEAAGFSSIYELTVSVLPTNRPVLRTDNPDLVFKTDQARMKAILIEVQRIRDNCRPVLVGTTSVDKSEAIASELLAAGIPFQVL